MRKARTYKNQVELMRSLRSEAIFMPPKRFSGDGCVYDENDTRISPLDDDYEYWKAEQERLTDPLSDDYCKYDNE